MTEALKPCPFCGKADDANNAIQESPVRAEQFRSPAGGMAYRVGCVCGASGESYRTVQECEAAWNRRASPWMPIETAPKDGTLVLVGGRHSGANPWWNVTTFDADGPTDEFKAPVLGWMPLPAPPSSPAVIERESSRDGQND